MMTDFDHLQRFLSDMGYWPDHYRPTYMTDDEMREAIGHQMRALDGLLLQVLFWVSNILSHHRLNHADPDRQKPHSAAQ